MRRAKWVNIVLVLLACTLWVVLAVSCTTGGGDGNDSDGDDPDGDDGDSPDGDDGGLTIYDIQDDTSANHPYPGTVVTLKGVVATSEKIVVSPSSNLRGFFIAEPAGGEYGGLIVVMKGEIDFDPVVGDELTVIGEYVEFCGTEETDVTEETICSSQIELSEVVVTGTGAAPQVQVIDDPSKIATRGELMYKWEHSLVQVQNVTVTDPDTGYGQFEVTGGLQVDDMIYKASVTNGQIFPKLTGFLYVSFGESKLTPRSAADLGLEAADGLSLADIQNPDSPDHPTVGSEVTVEGIVVTSDSFEVSSSGLMGIFVSDVGGGPWSGCMLTWKPTEVDDQYGYDPPAMSPGMVIDVTGNTEEFCGTDSANPYPYCSTQIELGPGSAVTDTGETADVPAPTVVAPADVKSGGSLAEQWQHSLISVEDVEVITAANSYDEFTVTGGLLVDDMLYDFLNPPVGTTYEALNGFLSTSYGDFKLLPRSATDMGGSADGDIDIPDGLKLYDIQNPDSPNHVSAGVQVTIEGVVVTSAVFTVSGDLKGVFVSDVGGGAWTGCLLTWKPTSAEPEHGYDPPAMSPGMVIDVTGKISEWCGIDNDYDSCSTQIELTPFQSDKGSVTDTGDTESVPAAQIVNPADVKTGGADAEKWQHSLVSVEDVMVIGAANQYAEFTVTGGLLVDDLLYAYTGPTYGITYPTLTGFLFTSYDDFKLTPRSASDMIEGAIDGDVDGDIIVDGDGDPSGLMINEIKYDQPSTDGTEIFVELYGPAGTSLDGCSIVGVNGNDDNEYITVSLNGKSIPNDGYFVITHSAATGIYAANSDLTTNDIDLQNGPDSVILRCSGEDVDILGYGVGATRFEGVVTDDVFGDNSLARDPDGVDTDNNRNDFIICENPTPGSENVGCVAVDGDTDGDIVDGDTDGDIVDGDTDGDIVDGDTDGDIVDGDTDGDIVDGDTDGDIAEAEIEIDGDIVDGDTDGDIVDGDTETSAVVVINEIYYDTPDSDESLKEFVELYGTPGASLDGYELVGNNGALEPGSDEYYRLDLSGSTIPVDGFFVIAHPGAESGLAALRDLSDDGTLWQNGADSIVLLLNDSPVDTLGYGSGANDSEGTPADDVYGAKSLARDPDGYDTNDNSVDFIACENPTPGATNDDCSTTVDGDLDDEMEVEDEAEVEGPTVTYTIHFNSGWTQPYLHYSLDGDENGSWTTTPGLAMTSEISEWWVIQVDLPEAADLVFLFNDGADQWHHPFGNPTGNFVTSDLEVWVKDGEMTLYPKVRIFDIQWQESGAYPGEGPVLIDNAAVSSNPFLVNASSNLYGAFVTSTGSTHYNSVMLIWKSDSITGEMGVDPSTLTPGMVVNLFANYDEYCSSGICNTQLEITTSTGFSGTITDTGMSSPASAPKLVDIPAQLSDDSTAQMYQGMLVEVQNVAVTTAANSYDEFEVTGNLLVDDMIYDYSNPALGTSYSSLVGFLYASYGNHKLLPRDSDDMVEVMVDGDVDGEVDGDSESVTSGVVINEIYYDTPDSDESLKEFVELYGTPGMSLNGYELVANNGSQEPGSDEYYSLDLSGSTIPDDGFFVIAHPSAESGLAAVRDLSDDGTLWQNGADSIVLLLNDSPVDTLGYGSGANDWEGSVATDVSNSNSLARDPDGYDTDDNSTDFGVCATPTPGTSNDPCFN